MSENMLLEINGLEKAYEGFALKGLNLAVAPETIVGFVGANGAGKTTTLKAVLGIIRPDAGSIRLFGEEVAPCSPNYVGGDRFAELRKQVGFVPDTCAWPLEYEVAWVGKVCQMAYDAWDAKRFAQLCKEFGLAGSKKIQELSRGMGMKLSLAVALCHGARLLVLDEATAGLDPLAREEMVDVLRKTVADDGCGILMSSHITSDLERAADQVVCIDDGRIVFNRPVDEICDLAGVAHCRAAQLDALLDSHAYEAGELRIHRGNYSSDVLIPDRFQFAEAFPEIAVDRVGIDEYLSLCLKGELR